MLGTTIVAALLFSAGLITGQRLVHQDNIPPLVSLSVTKEAQAAGEPAQKSESAEKLKTTFSFYEELTKPAKLDQPDVIKAAPAVKPKPKKVVKVEAKPEVKPEPKVEKPEVKVEEPAPAPAEKAEAKAEVKAEPKAEETPVAAPPAAAEAAPAQEAPKKVLPARYSLQVGSHPSKSAATRELSRLRAMGLEAHMITVNVPEKGRFYRVRVGKFHSMDEVRGFQAELTEKRGINGFITPL